MESGPSPYSVQTVLVLEPISQSCPAENFAEQIFAKDFFKDFKPKCTHLYERLAGYHKNVLEECLC